MSSPQQDQPSDLSEGLRVTATRDPMFFRFALYGFLKNLRFFDPYLILFFRDAGLSFLQIGVLYGVRDLGTSILELPASMVADTFGRRSAMVLSFVIYIISFLVFFIWPGFWPFALAMLFFAVGEALRTGTHKALILEHLRLNDMQDAKVSYYGRTRAASQLGSALNAVLAAALVFISGDYRYVFAAAAVPYVLDLINLLGYPRALDGEINALAQGDLGGRLKATLQEFLGVFRSPAALRAILNSSGYDAFFKATKDYMQPVLETLALALPFFLDWQDTQRTAVLVGAVYCGLYLVNSYASRSADRLSHRLHGLEAAINATFVLGAILLLVAGGSAWLSLAGLSVIVFVALYALHNLRRPLMVSYISDRISHQVMASGLSVESQVTTLMMAAIAPLLGWLADSLGVGAALALMGLAMVALWGAVRARGAEPATTASQPAA
jgi:predicted MFS family arabinose efflux permease